MLDFNLLLLFIAVLSPVVVLLRTWRRRRLNRNWQAAALIVLVVTGAAAAVVPRLSGYIGGAAWLLLLLVPATSFRRTLELAARQQFSAARKLAGVLRLLHPVDALREEWQLLRAMELAQNGETMPAVRILRRAQRASTRVSKQATALKLRLRQEWADLVDWSRNNVAQVGVGTDAALLPLYFRALGEVGLRDDLVLQFAGRRQALLASPLTQPAYDWSLTLVLAFCGRTEALRQLLRTRMRKLPRDVKDFWIATAEWAAGERREARNRLTQLHARTRDALVRRDCEQRLREWTIQQLLLPVAGVTESTLLRLEQDVEHRPAGMWSVPGGRRTPVVYLFLLINAAVFGLEVQLGGSTNPYVLQQLGALDPFRVTARGEYWRLFTTLFLHYGALHLLLNSYPLWLVGRVLESSMGSVRFLLAYVLAGLGSSVGVVLLWRYEWIRVDLLVGASGSVVGLIGVWAGLLLRHRTTPMAGRTLLVLLVIVVVQTLFDYYTPQISMAAHLCGLASGFVIGLLIAPKQLNR
jgi:rhomboid protease GluP